MSTAGTLQQLADKDSMGDVLVWPESFVSKVAVVVVVARARLLIPATTGVVAVRVVAVAHITQLVSVLVEQVVPRKVVPPAALPRVMVVAMVVVALVVVVEPARSGMMVRSRRGDGIMVVKADTDVVSLCTLAASPEVVEAAVEIAEDREAER